MTAGRGQRGFGANGLHIFLTDNGSLRPAATRQLRRLAQAVGRRVGRRVEAVSLLHASAVPARQLGGRKAEILELALRRRAEVGARDFLIVPLFLGRSRALTEYVPACVATVRRTFPGLRVRVAPPLGSGDEARLASLLEELVREKLTAAPQRGAPAHVVVVDHGSPVRAVTRVRNRVAAHLRRRLGRTVADVAVACMERRPGAEYAFAGPFLEQLLSTAPWNNSPVVLAQLFLLPGRHAGPGGDIAKVVGRVRAKHPRLRVVRTKLLGEHEGLVEMLVDRVRGGAGVTLART